MRTDARRNALPGWPSRLAVATLSLMSVSLAGGALTDTPTGGDRPVITSLRLDGTNVVVTARVPAGLRKVTLEARPQIARGAWEPRQVVRLEGNGGDVTFRLAQSAGMELMRVRADSREPLPAWFYRGTNVFASATGEGSPGDRGVLVMGGAGTVPGAGLDTAGAAGQRDVVESDIWKLEGDTLYFFNQNRGLQIIDVHSPDAPTVTGALELPGAGEQMYRLGAGHVVLLARDYCAGASQVLVVEASNGPPRIVATLAVPGYLQESRLVGSALYVASPVTRSVSTVNGMTWEYGTLLSAFDLAMPDQPVARNTFWFGGSIQAVAATDRFFFVAVQDEANWWQSRLQAVDITDPSGVMILDATIHPSGRVTDKFKLNLDGSVLSVVSEENRWVDAGWVLAARLETFRLADGAATPLGELELIRGEQVYASRFAGHRAYIVTFRRVDPLWVVDLSDPVHPRIAGEVQVPGWSTYLEPLGDQLVTVGFDTTNGGSRVAVQLFDVRDPAQPALLAKALLGDGYTWSEATVDEKAFNVLPQAGMILIPYLGMTTNGQAQRVQLIDLGSNSLTLRGVIDHPSQPRRATLHRDRILSLSGWELLSVDATDREHPLVRGKLELAWPVDRVFLSGSYLVELTSGQGAWGWGWWGASSLAPSLRVTPADQPDRVLEIVRLPNELPVAGATVQAGRLYLAQVASDYPWYGWGLPLSIAGDDSTNPPPLPPPTNFFLTVFDLSELPTLKVVAQEAAALEPFGYGTRLEAVWPGNSLLVWSGGGSGWPWLYWPVALDAGLVRTANLFWWPWYGGNGGRLTAFDVSNPAVPLFRSEVDLGTNGGWNFSSAFASDGLVFLSHDLVDYRWIPIPLAAGTDPVRTDSVSGYQTWWTQRSFLDVVDYADPLLPTVRQPVNIPAQLAGIGLNGALLYTVGQHAETNLPAAYVRWLDVSAYDGVSASLVASMSLPEEWPSPWLILGTNFFLGRPGGTNTAPWLERWALNQETGKLMLLDNTTLAAPADSLAGLDDLLAAHGGNQLELLDAPSLLKLGGGTISTCYWLDLNHADGARDRGLWVPLGSYGVKRIEITSPARLRSAALGR
jgi:hypothetical protein